MRQELLRTVNHLGFRCNTLQFATFNNSKLKLQSNVSWILLFHVWIVQFQNLDGKEVDVQEIKNGAKIV